MSPTRAAAIAPEVLQVLGVNGGPRWKDPHARTESASSPEDDRVLDFEEIRSVHSYDFTGIEFAIDQLIAQSAITLITGDAGSGKTTLITAAGAHVSVGADFLGRQCSQRKVLIFDRENALPVVQERLKRLRIQDGGDLRIYGAWSSKGDVPSPSCPSILEWVERTVPKPVIIVDSFIAFLEGDENSSSEVRPFMHSLRRLADLGAAVVVLHHSGKGESTKDYRGSSDIKAAIDIGYSLTNLGEGTLDRMRLKAFKTRFTVETDLIVRYSEGNFYTDDRPTAVTETVTDRLKAILRQNPGIGSKEFEHLADRQHLGRNRGRDFLKNGVEAGRIRLEPGPNNRRFHYLVEGEEE